MKPNGVLGIVPMCINKLAFFLGFEIFEILKFLFLRNSENRTLNKSRVLSIQTAQMFQPLLAPIRDTGTVIAARPGRGDVAQVAVSS